MSELLLEYLKCNSLVLSRNANFILKDKLELINSENIIEIIGEKDFENLLDQFAEVKTRFPNIYNKAHELSKYYSNTIKIDTLKDFDCDIYKDKVIDENWFMQQLKFHCDTNYCKTYNIAQMLYEVKSESKLLNLLSSNFVTSKLLRENIKLCMEHMVQNYSMDCIQFNTHINYLKIHPLLKVSLIIFIRKLDKEMTIESKMDFANGKFYENMKTIVCFFDCLHKLRAICMNIETKLTDKFIREHLLKSNFYETLILFSAQCARNITKRLNTSPSITEVELCFNLIESILKQKCLWEELNEKYENERQNYLKFLYDFICYAIKGTKFLANYKQPSICNQMKEGEIFLQVIFIAKFISNEKIIKYSIELADIVISVAGLLLKMDNYYYYSITPLEVFDNYTLEKGNDIFQLPSIPIDYLYDTVTLENFVKRVSIFGFSSRKQFEELFMSLLVLINKECESNILDNQEQYEIKRNCLSAITELILLCYKYPKLGFIDGKYFHSSRLENIKINTISLRKLHNIQLLMPITNIFYTPNLERMLLNTTNADILLSDDFISTRKFKVSQYRLNHIWCLLEDLNSSNIDSSNLVVKNTKYSIEKYGIDSKSTIQMIYNIYGQLIDEHFIMLLPNLAIMCDISDNREQIKWINNTIKELQEKVPMENTLAHGHIIYLLCKSYAILIPTLNEVIHLCNLIPIYFKTSQLYIKNATLKGVICLLECLFVTNTTIGGLSEELLLIRNVIINYVSKNGVFEESALLSSETHSKMIWATTFYLIETTSKFVPDCSLLSNSIISANNILKRTNNLEIYLCILYGLERLVVINAANALQIEKIEKLALDLLKLDNEVFSLPALKLLISCMYTGLSDQLEITEKCNGIVQDEPEVILQQIEKVEMLFSKIRTSTTNRSKIFGYVLCQIIKDLFPPSEILTKIFKEMILNQPNPDIIASVSYQVFRSAIDSSQLYLLQEFFICYLPNILALPQNKSVWCLTVIFISASLNQHLIKMFPEVLSLLSYHQISEREKDNFIVSAKDFYDRLPQLLKLKFREIFNKNQAPIYKYMLESL